jgi:hypothetical protein
MAERCSDVRRLSIISHSSPPSIMSSSVPSTSTSQLDFASIFNPALDAYKRKTKKDLSSHPLLPKLESCDSPDAVLTALHKEIPTFSESENSDNRLTKWIMPTVKVVLGFSSAIAQGVGLVNIRIFLRGEFLFLYRLSGISTGECYSCWDQRSPHGWRRSCLPSATDFYTRASQALKDDSSSRDKLIDAFTRIEHFFQRLEIYINIKPSVAMTKMIVDIMVEVLNVLALATKEVKRERLSELMSHKFTIRYSYFYLERVFRRLAGNTDLEDSLQTLDSLTRAEAQMASTEQLRIAHIIDGRVESVQGDVQGARADVRAARDDVQGVGHGVQVLDWRVQGIDMGLRGMSGRVQGVDDQLSRDIRSLSFNSHPMALTNLFSGNRLRDSIRQWLSAPDPSTNHIIARKARHKDTAQWFFQGNIFEEWKSTGPFLWLHGKRASLLAFTMR